MAWLEAGIDGNCSWNKKQFVKTNNYCKKWKRSKSPFVKCDAVVREMQMVLQRLLFHREHSMISLELNEHLMQIENTWIGLLKVSRQMCSNKLVPWERSHLLRSQKNVGFFVHLKSLSKFSSQPSCSQMFLIICSLLTQHYVTFWNALFNEDTHHNIWRWNCEFKLRKIVNLNCPENSSKCFQNWKSLQCVFNMSMKHTDKWKRLNQKYK